MRCGIENEAGEIPGNAREIGQHRTTESTGTHDQNRAVQQTLLRLCTETRQDQMP